MIKRNITFTKGDSRAFKLRILMADGKYFVPSNAYERLVFEVRPTPNSQPVLTKAYPNQGIEFDDRDNYFRLIIQPQDTDNLCAEMPYMYKFKLYSDYTNTEITVVGGIFELKE